MLLKKFWVLLNEIVVSFTKMHLLFKSMQIYFLLS